VKRFLVLLFLAAIPLFAADTKLIVYREHHSNAWEVAPSVFVDGKEVANLGNGRYLELAVSPGKHQLQSSKSPTIEIETKEGETSYFELQLVGTYRIKGRLIPMSAHDAKPILERLKPADHAHVYATELK
jgi:hypothetical protein